MGESKLTPLARTLRKRATEAGRAADEIRDRALQEAGFRVLHFWNHQVHSSMEAVREHIHEVCQRR